MEGYLEAIDVLNDEYLVYDSDGRRVALTAVKVPTRMLFGLVKGTAEVVRVGGVEPEPTHAVELTSKLRAHLAALDEAVPDDATLPELLARLLQRAGFVA